MRKAFPTESRSTTQRLTIQELSGLAATIDRRDGAASASCCVSAGYSLTSHDNVVESGSSGLGCRRGSGGDEDPLAGERTDSDGSVADRDGDGSVR